MNRFIDEKKDNWQRLEDLLSMLSGTGLRGLSKMEVREFGELYRRAATDLAIARAETRDPKLINYLNNLVIRAHGKIYRSEGDGKNAIVRYFSHELPEAFRQTLRFTGFSFFFFMFCAVASFFLCFYDPNFSNLIGLGPAEAAASSNLRWWLSLNEANQVGSTRLQINNIQVAFNAFAFGAFFGIGTLYILLINGLHIGGVLGVCFRVDPNFGAQLVDFMVAHGMIELSCIFIAAGTGMSIGYSIIVPGDLSRGQALKKSGRTAARLIIGCAIFLFIAGIIEGFISPSALPPQIKWATGILTGTLMLSYLFFVGDHKSPRSLTRK